MARSVDGSSSRSATFWNHGVSVRLACSCRIVGSLPHGAGQPAERRRAIPVQVQDVDLLAVDDLQQRRQRRGIELRPVQVLDVDAEAVERLLGQVLLSQADQRDVEAGRVEPRDHPREQALDAVHARAFPPQVIAHLQDVQSPAHAGACCARDPTTLAGTPTAMARGGTSAVTTAPAPTMASAPIVDAVEHLRAGAQPGPGAHRHAGGAAPLLEHRPAGVLPVVVAADDVAVGRQQRARAQLDARRRENLAVEADVGALAEHDVAVLARQDRVAADEACPAPMAMPALLSPLASSRQLSSMTTSSPM